MSKTWKNRERQVANYFGGAGRTPLSGINSKITAADIIHPFLAVEHKHRKKHSILNIWDKIKKVAQKEEKIPVVTISEHGRPGFWILCHSKDLLAIANQRTRGKNAAS